MLSDEELVCKAKLGDENAENELLERYKGLVVKIARSYFILGGEMEDIVQEGMIGLYKALKGYDKKKNASFKTFATMCIKHQIQSAIKVANAKKNSPLSNSVSLQSFSENSDDDDFLPVNLIFQVSPDEKIINKEDYRNLLENIKKMLSEKELQVLKYYLKGYTYKEISNILGTSEKSIDNSLSRIKSKIKKLTENNNLNSRT